jgi:hypothetical protein
MRQNNAHRMPATESGFPKDTHLCTYCMLRESSCEHHSCWFTLFLRQIHTYTCYTANHFCVMMHLFADRLHVLGSLRRARQTDRQTPRQPPGWSNEAGRLFPTHDAPTASRTITHSPHLHRACAPTKYIRALACAAMAVGKLAQKAHSPGAVWWLSPSLPPFSPYGRWFSTPKPRASRGVWDA